MQAVRSIGPGAGKTLADAGVSRDLGKVMITVQEALEPTNARTSSRAS
jgi:hypothetical protein